jgi:hypothetical protein
MSQDIKEISGYLASDFINNKNEMIFDPWLPF